MSISIKDLLPLIGNINIIDIRSIEKYNDNHIPTAKNIPMILLIKNPQQYLEKNKIYYIYCQMGINSNKVCINLRKKGYQVVDIKSGYEGWLLEKWALCQIVLVEPKTNDNE